MPFGISLENLNSSDKRQVSNNINLNIESPVDINNNDN